MWPLAGSCVPVWPGKQTSLTGAAHSLQTHWPDSVLAPKVRAASLGGRTERLYHPVCADTELIATEHEAGQWPPVAGNFLPSICPEKVFQVPGFACFNSNKREGPSMMEHWCYMNVQHEFVFFACRHNHDIISPARQSIVYTRHCKRPTCL